MTAPDVEQQVEQIVRAAVGHGTTAATAWPSQPVTGPVFAELVPRVLDERLVGVVAQAIYEGAFAVSQDQHDLIRNYHSAAQHHALQLEALLLKLAGLYRTSRIDFRVLKGLALGRVADAEPAWRTTTDIDVLVRSEDFGRAVKLVQQHLHGEVVVAELRGGFDREFGKDSLVRVGRLEVDIHRTLVAGPFGLMIELDRLFEQPAMFTLGDVELPTFDATLQFLHACYNVALGDYPVRLRALRDVVLSSELDDTDIARAESMARDWDATAVLQRAGQVAAEHLGGAVSTELARFADLRVSRRERILMASYLTSSRSYSRQLASLMVIPGLSARFRFARATFVPSAEYLRSRDTTLREHSSRAVRRLRARR